MTIIAFGHYVLTDENEMAGLSHLSMRSRGTGSDLGGTRDHSQTCQLSLRFGYDGGQIISLS